MKAGSEDDIIAELYVVEDEDDMNSTKYFVRQMARVLSSVVEKSGDRVVSSFLSMFYSTLFDMRIMKAHVRRAGNCRRMVKAHAALYIVENSFVSVKYYCEVSKSDEMSVVS